VFFFLGSNHVLGAASTSPRRLVAQAATSTFGLQVPIPLSYGAQELPCPTTTLWHRHGVQASPRHHFDSDTVSQHHDSNMALQRHDCDAVLQHLDCDVVPQRLDCNAVPQRLDCNATTAMRRRNATTATWHRNATTAT
jgi:hypothetical protein